MEPTAAPAGTERGSQPYTGPLGALPPASEMLSRKGAARSPKPPPTPATAAGSPLSAGAEPSDLPLCVCREGKGGDFGVPVPPFSACSRHRHVTERQHPAWKASFPRAPSGPLSPGRCEERSWDLWRLSRPFPPPTKAADLCPFPGQSAVATPERGWGHGRDHRIFPV